jgi:hypothetical protein
MASADEGAAGDTSRDDPVPDSSAEEGGAAVDVGESVPEVVMGIYVIVCRMCKTMLCRGDELLQDEINSDPKNGCYFVEVICADPEIRNGAHDSLLDNALRMRLLNRT